MQALLLIGIFSLFVSLVTGVIVAGGKNITELQVIQREQTETWFQQIENVIQSDLTPRYLHAIPPQFRNSDFLTLLRSPDTPLRALNLGRRDSNGVTDAALDSWNNPIQVLTVTENVILNVSGTDIIAAPVTTVALISAGPDGALANQLTTRLAALSDPAAAQILGLESFQAGDDIIRVFSNLQAQQLLWDNLRFHLQRIAQSALRHYQQQLADPAFQQRLGVSYTAALQANTALTMNDILNSGAADIPSFTTLFDAPGNSLADVARLQLVMQNLGLTEDYLELTKLRGFSPDTFNFQLWAERLNNGQVLRLILTEDVAGSNNTPWTNGGTGALRYTLEVKGHEPS